MAAIPDSPFEGRSSPTGFPAVAVIGGGFSGAMTAVQLLRNAVDLASPISIVLFEKEASRVARGIAYSTIFGEHLLNVPAAKMSAWPDRPDDFLEWARQRDATIGPGDFLPRRLYGDYLAATLRKTALAAGNKVRFLISRSDVAHVTRAGDGRWRIGAEGATKAVADYVVLATGHRPPADPLAGFWTGARDRYLSQPWRDVAWPQIAPDDDVVILGSGLSAVDWILTLASQPGAGRYTLVSRNGLLPQPHQPGVVPLDLNAVLKDWLGKEPGNRLRTVCQGLRKLASTAGPSGGNWRAVIDGLRPHTARIWQALGTAERARFLARLRPFWEVHRHRMAPDAAARIESLRKNGRLHVLAGSCRLAAGSDRSVRLEVRERRTGRPIHVQADWLINCTGPAAFGSVSEDPLLTDLSGQGLIVRDPAGLGIETDQAGNVCGADGKADPTLKVIGTLRKPALWESTAVPELRHQAAAIAEEIVAGLRRSQVEQEPQRLPPPQPLAG